MSLTAYVRYDNQGRIVPGGPIVTSVKPKVGDWVAISDVLVTTTPPNYKLRAFVRYINRIGGQNNSNKYVAGSLILQHDAPQDGNWKEVYFIKPCESCNPVTTTTTTTTCVPFISTIVISNGSYTAANGTYTRDNPSGAFALTGGGGSIFFAGEDWYIFNTAVGNVARNTSTLGTGTWEAWSPGNSSGISAVYIYSNTTTTTSTSTSTSTSTTTSTSTSTTTTTTTV